MPTQERRLPGEPLKGPLITPRLAASSGPSLSVPTLGVTGAASSLVPVKVTCSPCTLLHFSVGQGQPPGRAQWGPASPTFRGASLPFLCQPPGPPCGPPGPRSFSLGPLSVQPLPLVSVRHNTHTHTCTRARPLGAPRLTALAPSRILLELRAPSPQPSQTADSAHVCLRVLPRPAPSVRRLAALGGEPCWLVHTPAPHCDSRLLRAHGSGGRHRLPESLSPCPSPPCSLYARVIGGGGRWEWRLQPREQMASWAAIRGSVVLKGRRAV